MRREPLVDFFEVRPEHLAVHERLEEWGRWVKVRPFGYWQVGPMFRQYRPDGREERARRRDPRPAAVNVPEAMEIEQAVSGMSEQKREALRWYYYWTRIHPLEAKAVGKDPGLLATTRRIGVSKQGLLDLIHQGRTMLRNRVCG